MCCECERKEFPDLMTQYAVKLVCGKCEEGKPISAGVYYTAVNVHNPHCDAVGLRWKVAVASPTEEPGFITRFMDLRLEPDGALEIDCDRVMRWLRENGYSADFVKGWVVIESKVTLDVDAVYTATAPDSRGVVAFHTERVCGRYIKPCPY